MEQPSVDNPMRHLRARGFTLTELLFAVLLLTLIILMLVGLTTSALHSNEKAARLGQATDVAESLLSRTLYDVEWDLPAGTRSSFWAASGGSAWRPATKVTLGGTEYEVTVYVDTVSDTGGTPVGTVAGEAGNRVKKVDLVLNWWDSRQAGGQRQGYGRLEIQATRLVNEVAP
ncbi:MAG: hypothetical protein HY319_02870 [Armatimonadetes bacterium]|nr:hypothetical protein [Armatimonadota bacterium]